MNYYAVQRCWDSGPLDSGNVRALDWRNCHFQLEVINYNDTGFKYSLEE